VPDLRSRFRGTLVGAAVGDALGARFEGANRVYPEDLVAIRTRLERERPIRLRWTDDTAMTIGLAESLIERRGFDGAHVAAVFARHHAAEPWRGYGAGPPRIFAMLERGVPWDEAAASMYGGSGSFGNGAAMRVSPAGLFAHRDLEEVAEVARGSAVVTHTHPLGVEGAVLQAVAVALLVRRPEGEPLDPVGFTAALVPHVREPEFEERLEAIPELLADGSGGEVEEVVRRLGNGIEAHRSVPTALLAFLRHPTSFVDAALAAIGFGGDADTIGSMAGALAGAHLGWEAIPEVWREGVEAAERLVELADGLLEASAERAGAGSQGR
jgi:poly(ADP-ribose) glycohydrolase ARH3